MISAVAARKAAKAAAAASNSPPSKAPSPPPPSRSPSQASPLPSPPRTSKPKPTSKRKPSIASNAGPSRNKKVKVTHAPAPSERHARYFTASEALDDAQNGDAVEDATDRVSSETDSSSEEDMERNAAIPPSARPETVSVKTAKRAWSPSRPVTDSSEEEEARPSTSFYPTPSTSKVPEASPLSTFRPVLNHNVFLAPEKSPGRGSARILVIHPNETLALVGSYLLCVLQGNLSLLGVTLASSNTTHAVFAPRSSPIPILSWAPPDRQGFCTYPIPSAVLRQANTTAILVEYADTGVEGLGRICRVFDNVFSLPRASDAVPGIDIPELHLVHHGIKTIQPFVFPISWEAALASIEDSPDSSTSAAPICLVKGSKKCGKSTLTRSLVNRLLSRYRRVAFLECDLGQSEFTPGGLAALNIVENYIFGPPFTHPSLPYRAHYIGAASPRASPSHYLHAIQSLLETYRVDLQFFVGTDEPMAGDERIQDSIPLVVNTMGWSKGLGADLNARIQEFVEPSHVFEMDGTEEKGLAPYMQPQPQHGSQISLPSFMQTSATRCLKVEAIHPDTTSTYYTATDLRHLNILSYFHAVFPELPTPSSGPVLRQTTASVWDTSLPLCAQYPYEVDCTQAFDHVYLTGPGYEDVVPSELTRVLNGAIVGLVTTSPTNTFSTPSTSEEPSLLPYTPGEPPPDVASSTCHGLALIRGLPLSLNTRSPHLHMLTPLPTGLLTHTRVLVKGEMELPIWGMLDFREEEEGKVAGVERGQVPYLQWGKGEGIGGEKRRVRRNLMRKGQL